MKNEYIKEISKYQDILKSQITTEKIDFYTLSEKECIYNDINNYFYDNFDGWYTKDFIQYILYLEKLTGITNTLNIKKGGKI